MTVPELLVSSDSLLPVFVAARDELNLDVCLASGQTFSWAKIGNFWANVIEEHLLILLNKGDEGIYAMIPASKADHKESTLQLIRRYFRLDTALEGLHSDWSLRDPHYRAAAAKCPGVRLLRQPPFESMVAFICSQNNGIIRITSMVAALKENFGKLVGSLDGISLYAFPRPADLAVSGMEERLRQLGFGYRAGYIPNVAKLIVEGELDLQYLMAPEEPTCYDPENYQRTWTALRAIKGIGPKVADCIALTGFGHMDAVPIDTHIWRVARTKYTGMPTGLSLTLTTYITIGNHFRKIFGSKAGWAHLVLFAAQIRRKSGNGR